MSKSVRACVLFDNLYLLMHIPRINSPFNQAFLFYFTINLYSVGLITSAKGSQPLRYGGVCENRPTEHTENNTKWWTIQCSTIHWDKNKGWLNELNESRVETGKGAHMWSGCKCGPEKKVLLACSFSSYLHREWFRGDLVFGWVFDSEFFVFCAIFFLVWYD